MLIRLLGGLMILGLVAGCSSTSITTDFSETTDFTVLKTFMYKDTDFTLEASNQLAHRRVVDALRREMVAEGFTEVDSNPDVYISYYASTSEQIVLNTTHMGYGFGSSWHRHGMGVTQSTTTSSTFTTGTMVIDMWKAAEKELIWRGTVEKTLSNNPEQNTEKINDGIRRVFERFPPPSG